MIKLVFKIILILIVFVALDQIIGLGLERIRDNSTDGIYFKAQYSLEKGKEDIIIFGNSTAEINLVSNIFRDSLKMSCWNSGRQAQSLPYWECMEQGILNRYVPKIAIVDIDDDFLTYDMSKFYDVAGVLRPFYTSHKEIRPILNNISYYEKYCNYSQLYSFNSSYYYLLRPYFIQGIDGTMKGNGWKPENRQMQKMDSKPTIILTSNKLNNKTIVLFEKFCSNLTSRGCKVFVTISPRLNENILSTSTIRYIKNMKNISLISYDDNDLFTNNYHFYMDPIHLNVPGAIKFTTLLVKKIRKFNVN